MLVLNYTSILFIFWFRIIYHKVIQKVSGYISVKEAAHKSKIKHGCVWYHCVSFLLLLKQWASFQFAAPQVQTSRSSCKKTPKKNETFFLLTSILQIPGYTYTDPAIVPCSLLIIIWLPCYSVCLLRCVSMENVPGGLAVVTKTHRPHLICVS